MITRRRANIGLAASAADMVAGGIPSALRGHAIELPPPRGHEGKPVINALQLRRSICQYAPRPLPPQALQTSNPRAGFC
jgi:hypothetical protein